jgi:hypothetical protein
MPPGPTCGNVDGPGSGTGAGGSGAGRGVRLRMTSHCTRPIRGDSQRSNSQAAGEDTERQSKTFGLASDALCVLFEGSAKVNEQLFPGGRRRLAPIVCVEREREGSKVGFLCPNRAQAQQGRETQSHERSPPPCAEQSPRGHICGQQCTVEGEDAHRPPVEAGLVDDLRQELRLGDIERRAQKVVIRPGPDTERPPKSTAGDGAFSLQRLLPLGNIWRIFARHAKSIEGVGALW